MITLVVKAILAYLLGALVGSLLVGRLRGGIDIRRLGSGNAGGTNALRTQGKAFAFWVMLIDIGKGWLATGVLCGLSLPGLPSGPQREWTLAICGIAVMIGHVYPVWFEFKGGKGVATLIGAVLGVAPMLLLPMLAVWLLAVMLVGYVGLASILGAVTFALEAARHRVLLPFAAVAAVIIIYTHRSNIRRMLTGTEPRARRLWLFAMRSRSS
jgi:glycerol-3-phosphate acyltransferase PlsY